MAKPKGQNVFDHESTEDPETIAKYLEAMEQGFRSGRLLFCSGKDEVVYKPSGLLNFNIKAKRKDGAVKLTVKVEWKEEGTKPRKDSPLVIGSADDEQD